MSYMSGSPSKDRGSSPKRRQRADSGPENRSIESNEAIPY